MLNIVNNEFSMTEALEKAKQVSKARKFNESFEVIVKLNVDPTKGD